MKKIALLICAILIICLSFALVSCKCEHEYGEWTVTKAATCSTVGEQERVCSKCEEIEKGEIPVLTEGGHSFGDWQAVTEPTFDTDGSEKRECALCGKDETRPIDKLSVAYTITVNIDGVESFVKVPVSGAYELTEPVKVGYAFTGWTDGSASFPSTGVVSENKTVTASFEILPTKTFDELKTRLEGGADKILIADNITLTDTICIIGEVEIYTLGNYTLTRDASFTKDLFVLGEDKNGDSSILSDSFAKVTIKPAESASLTIDGNKSNLTDKVVGTAFFMTSGSTLNIYDGVTLQNHKKLGNEKILDTKYAFGENELIGGSVAIINDGTFNMYGGEIKNNEVNPYYSGFVNEEDKVDGYKNSSYGGVIYNVGVVNVYGGTISQNLASYGGFIYNSRELNIEAGTIENNTATAYGGVVFSANTGSAITYIGSSEGDITESKIFINNNVAKGGGAIYMLYNTSTVIYGNVVFDGNKAEVSYDGKDTLGLNGGAICSAGELVIFYAEFKNNHATYYGGAIHTSYTAEDKVPRVTLIHDVKFDSNTAKGGGALMVSGTKVTLNNVTATNNSATSKGGGFAYLSLGELEILSGEIKGSSCTSSGGAFYLAGSKLVLSGSENNVISITENTTTDNGGAICSYIHILETVVGKDENGDDIIEKTTTRSSVKLSYAEFKNNTSTTESPYGGGAVYASSTDVTAENVLFEANSAIYGGAISLFSSATLTANTVTFKDNTAKVNGGVMYTSKSTANLTNVTVTGNKATGYTIETDIVDEEGEPTGEKQTETIAGNGGAFYINSTSTFNGTSIVATGNTASNGGFMFAGAKSVIKINGESTIKSNSATSTESQSGGGAFYLKDCTGSIEGATISENTASNGGAISIFASEGFKIDGCTFDKNTVTATGGTFYFNTSAVTIDGCTVTGSDADGNGGIIYSTTCDPVAILNSTFESNNGAQGLIYLTKSTFTSTNDKYLNNTSKYGTYYVNSGSNLTINNGTMNGNTANFGSCIYLKYGNLTIDGLVANNNTATKGNGGAINISSNATVISQVTIKNATFDNNKVTYDSSTSSGGAIAIADGANVTMTDVVFTNNQAVSGGGAVALIDGTLTINGITATGNSTTGYTDGSSKKGGGGGALNIGAGSFTLGQGTTITKNTFTGNVAQSGGGAIYCYNTETVFTMGDATFKNNVASTNYGGALYIRGSSITVDIGNIVAEGNTATNGNGGAVYLYAFKNGTIDSLVANNNSAKSGGTIYIAGSCSVTFGEMSGSGNSATGSSVGGYGYIGSSTVKILSGTIGENEDATGYAFHLGVNVSIDASKFTYPEGGADAPSKFVAITE